MVARRDESDGIDRAVEILRSEMRVGFERLDGRIEAVTVRVENLSDRVVRHGELISGLQALLTQPIPLSTEVTRLKESLLVHRAKDTNSDPLNEEPKWHTRQLTTAAAIAATTVVMIIEILRWISNRIRLAP